MAGVDVVVGAIGEVLVEGAAPRERLRFGPRSSPGGSSGTVPDMAKGKEQRYKVLYRGGCTVAEQRWGTALRYHESRTVQVPPFLSLSHKSGNYLLKTMFFMTCSIIKESRPYLYSE